MKIDIDQVRECLKSRLVENGRHSLLDECRQLQAVAYVMCGSGFLGHSAATHPSGFYVDSRVAKYSVRDIRQAVSVLEIYADILGLNASDLNPSTELGHRTFMDCHNCGIF